jgi:hypothetical protein
MYQRSSAVAHSGARTHWTIVALCSAQSFQNADAENFERMITAVPQKSMPPTPATHACVCAFVCVRVRACAGAAGSPAQPPAVWKSGSGQ